VGPVILASDPTGFSSTPGRIIVLLSLLAVLALLVRQFVQNRKR
jgi:hypothetical protein